MQVEVELLGPLGVTVDGEPVPISRPQSRIVLALLAVRAGDWVSPDQLASEFWPDRLPKSPKTALQISISRLRSAIGDADHSVVESGPNGYRLNRDKVAIDLTRWQHAIDMARTAGNGGSNAASIAQVCGRARAIWRGDPFVAIDAPGPTIDDHGQRLRLERVEIARIEARARGRLGQVAEAVAILDQASADAPYREDLMIDLMELLAGAGRRDEALTRAREFRVGMRDELGLSPTTDFDSAEQAILGFEGSGTGRVLPAPATGFVWRSEFIDQVVERIDRRLRAGENTITVTVEGHPGSGRSTVGLTIRRHLTILGYHSAPLDAISPHRAFTVATEPVTAPANNEPANGALAVDSARRHPPIKPSLSTVRDAPGSTQVWLGNLSRPRFGRSSPT